MLRRADAKEPAKAEATLLPGRGWPVAGGCLPAGLALTETWEAYSSVAPWSEEVAEGATDGAERRGRARLVLGGAC